MSPRVGCTLNQTRVRELSGICCVLTMRIRLMPPPPFACTHNKILALVLRVAPTRQTVILCFIFLRAVRRVSDSSGPLLTHSGLLPTRPYILSGRDLLSNVLITRDFTGTYNGRNTHGDGDGCYSRPLLFVCREEPCFHRR